MTLLEELTAILQADLPDQNEPAKLAIALYNRCYTVSISDDSPAAGPSVDPDDLIPRLAAANQSRASWDEGWRIDQLLDGGRILARKGAAARSFLPGEYLTHRGIGTGPGEGSRISIFLPRESTDLQSGFYFAFSETVSEFEESEPMVRFFWNVTCDGAPRLVEAITREFNRFQIPFRFKCANRCSDYPRRDAAVLYLHPRYYPISTLVVEGVHEQLLAWLNPGTPLFAKRLAHGLGLAEDSGDSFGENRMKILAAAMAASSGKHVDDRLAEVRRQFEQRGLSFDQSWLNSGSFDRYPFPYPAA